MKAQRVLVNASSLGTFLTRMLSLLPCNFENEPAQRSHHDVSHAAIPDVQTAPGVVIRDVAGAAAPRALRMMLRERQPRHYRAPWSQLSLPRGCVLAVRCTSR